MTTIIVILLLVVLLGGGGYWGYNRWGNPANPSAPNPTYGPNLVGLLVLVLVIILIVWLVQEAGFIHIGR